MAKQENSEESDESLSSDARIQMSNFAYLKDYQKKDNKGNGFSSLLSFFGLAANNSRL